VTTLRRKWHTFQKDGFGALARSDRDQSRKHKPEWIESAKIATLLARFLPLSAIFF
jgi:hypothetical protein